MDVVCANKLNFDPHQKLGEIFVDGFYEWLKYFSKDKEKLTKAFSHMFNLDVFYCALSKGEIMGIAALNDGKKPTVRLVKSEMQRSLGWFRGLVAYKILRREFMDKKYPFEIKRGMGCVEFVATSPAHRRKGVASEIIKFFMENSAYDEYVLEVADTNTNAVKLYEKLGFKEFMRVEMKHKRQSGINYLLYLSCGK